MFWRRVVFICAPLVPSWGNFQRRQIVLLSCIQSPERTTCCCSSQIFAVASFKPPRLGDLGGFRRNRSGQILRLVTAFEWNWLCALVMRAWFSKKSTKTDTICQVLVLIHSSQAFRAIQTHIVALPQSTPFRWWSLMALLSMQRYCLWNAGVLRKNTEKREEYLPVDSGNTYVWHCNSSKKW